VLDTLDLSLHVLRGYAGPLLLATALAAVPLMVINQLLLGWMFDSAEEQLEYPFRFVWHMSILVFIQAPLASVFATAYLGEAVFLERPRLLSIVMKVGRLLPPLVWCQLLIRGVVPAWLLVLTIERYDSFSFPVEGLAMVALVVYVAGLRAFRPFINEIILLEQNPLIARGDRVMTVSRRSGMLHGPSSGDLFFRWTASAIIGLLLVFAVYGVFLFASGVILHDWHQGAVMIQFLLPLAMWITAWFFTVVRFLSYLDVRIRQEGWEVELRLRAEAARLASKLA
jgi:hypothetical protein